MRRKYLATIFVLLALTLPTSPAHAAGVVSVCDEAHLKTALTGGGTVTFICSGTITLTSTITISKNTTIDGSGQSVTISGNNAVGVFKVNAGMSLSLNRLTILNGVASSDNGGAVHNYGTLNIHNSAFYLNRSNNRGGAIHNEAGATLVVGQSTFNENYTPSFGGAIENLGTATVYNSTFVYNFASYGGAIDNIGVLTVVNSTFSDNLASSGASIYGDSPVLLQNTILVGNEWNGGCAGSITDGGGNLSYSDTTCPGINADPALGSLQDNGGLTQTMALGAGSPAIDAGNTAGCQNAQINNRDQRGYARFVDGNGDKVAACDIGAYEYGSTAPPPTGVLDPDPPVVTIGLTPAEPDGANGWYHSPVTVRPDVTDASPVIELRCALDPAGPPAAFDDLPEENCPFLGGDQVAAEGRHTFYAAAMDVWGNKSAPVSASFKIDTPPPGLTSLEMTVNRGEAYAGAILEYKLTVRNLTPAEQAFAVTDPIPANTEIVRRINYNPATNAVEWSGVLEPWGFKTFTVYVRIKSGTPGGTAIVNTATIQDDAASCSASATTIVKTLPPYRGHRADVDVNEVVIRGK
jgi:hypothetical protein